MESDEAFEMRCLKCRVEGSTLREYTLRAARVRRITDLPLGYEAIRRYIRLKQHLSTQTLRSTKSAVLYILDLAGQPLRPEWSERLDDILDGHECMRGRPARVRGAPGPEQIQSLVAAARENLGNDSAAALVVGHGCTARSQDLEALENEDVDLERLIVWVPRKGRRIKKVRLGGQVERPILTPEAEQVLRALKSARTGKLFPALDVRRLSKFVSEHAAAQGWDPDLWWSGVHNLRHGSAAGLYAEGIARVRAAGSWSGPDAEQRYGRLGRVGPKDRARFRSFYGKK
jgi:integrase